MFFGWILSRTSLSELVEGAMCNFYTHFVTFTSASLSGRRRKNLVYVFCSDNIVFVYKTDNFCNFAPSKKYAVGTDR